MASRASPGWARAPGRGAGDFHSAVGGGEAAVGVREDHEPAPLPGALAHPRMTASKTYRIAADSAGSTTSTRSPIFQSATASYGVSDDVRMAIRAPASRAVGSIWLIGPTTSDVPTATR